MPSLTLARCTGAFSTQRRTARFSSKTSSISSCACTGSAHQHNVWRKSVKRESTLGSNVQGNTEQLTQQPLAANSSNAAATPGSASGATAPSWDLDWFHYTNRLYQPYIVVLAGVAFIIACNLATEPSLKTTIIAGTPVLFAWFIFLVLIPRQFKDFAKQYIKTHPECEEHAREVQQLQQQAQSVSDR